MKYIDEFRDGTTAKQLAAAIRREAGPARDYRLMEFCGGHTHAIFRYGVQQLLPENVRFVHGPGCPVCVLPAARIDMAMRLAIEEEVILCTYADLMRVPTGKGRSLQQAKAAGADIRMVYSSLDALTIARNNPERQVVFFAIGFETTTPPTAAVVLQAEKERIGNFSVFCNHVLTPAAIHRILDSDDVRIDGFLGPAHVSTVIGSRPYEVFASEYRKPVVIGGFEPLDVMQAALMLVRQLNEGRNEVENEYIRAVSRDGNVKAKAMMAEVFEQRASFEWRGLGRVEKSALQVRDKYSGFDAEKRFDMPATSVDDIKGCLCPEVLRGVKEPTDCKLFGTACTPSQPKGACMVSSEGACAAVYSYGRQAAAA